MHKPPKKRPLVDPRKKPGSLPEGSQFIRGRQNPGYGFAPHIDFKPETKHEAATTPITAPVVQRKKPKLEWKKEVKPSLSQLPVVIGELRDSVTSKAPKVFNQVIARINRVYIHKLSENDAATLVGEISSMLDSVPKTGSYFEQLMQLVRSLFIKCNVSAVVSLKFYESVKSRAGKDMSYVFSLLEVMLKTDKISTEACSDLIPSAKKKLFKDADISRVYTAKFLIAFLKRSTSDEEKDDLKSHLMKYCSDRCPKVRRIVIEGIEEFFEREQAAPLEYYDLFTELTRNLDMFVRLTALRIVKLYAAFYPEQMMTKNRNFPLRMTDDAFTVVCHAMNDLVVEVRSQAATLLGTFENVTETFLFQTLDKKLMKNMRRLADGKIVGGTSSEWSTGKKLGEDCPFEAQEEESQSMIPTGACGAFVTALEDEFKAVRQPAVYSLGKLGVNRPAFANASIGHLADMFNDEIAVVRIDAIRALTPLVTHGVLELEQLKTLLTGFDDASQESRVALMELVSKSNFLSQECLSYLLKRLLDTMERYSDDKEFIFKCISSIGLRHAELVGDIVCDVFKLHPYLERQEEKIDDVFYLTKLILILNAASQSTAVCALLPNYVKKHYRFLRLSMPNIVHSIADFDAESQVVTVNTKDQSKQREEIDKIVGREYDRLLAVLEKKDNDQRIKNLRQLLNDVKFFLSVEPEFANASNYLYALTDLVLVMNDILNNVMNGDIPPLIQVQEAMEKVSLLSYRFNGVDKNVQMFLMECSLVLCLVYCGARLLLDPAFGPTFSRIATSEVERVTRGLAKLGRDPTKRLKRLVKFLRDVATQKPVGGALLEFAGTVQVKLESRAQNLPEIGFKTVKVVEPAEVTKVQLINELPTGVYVNCILNHFTEQDIEQFKVKVKYYDETCSYFLPPRSDFEKLGDDKWRLRTQVIVIAREGLVLAVLVDLTFGLFIHRPEVQSTLFFDRCFAFPPSVRTSANENGYFVSLPDADNVLIPASCQVLTKPMPPRTV